MAIVPIHDVTAADATSPARAVTQVPAVAPVGEGASVAFSGGQQADSQRNDKRREQAVGAADYARALAQISDIMQGLTAQRPQANARARAEERIVALLPEPVVIIPMFPASTDMVERAVETAQHLADQAALAMAAQANINAGAVDNILSRRV